MPALPAGPRAPLAFQTAGLLLRQRAYLERLRRRHGSLFSLRVLGLGPLVVLSDPALIKTVFQSDAKVLHAGERSPLQRILGPSSLLGIDEDRHLAQRRMLLPSFKGERVRSYTAVIEEIAGDRRRWQGLPRGDNPRGAAHAPGDLLRRARQHRALRAGPPPAATGARIGLAAALAHFDERLFDAPDRFRPERFLERSPDTYSWIPFGGGVRRCTGATFAHLEMDVVLRVLLQRMTLEPTTAPPERWASRGVAMAPAGGGVATFTRRRSPGRPRGNAPRGSSTSPCNNLTAAARVSSSSTTRRCRRPTASRCPPAAR